MGIGIAKISFARTTTLADIVAEMRKASGLDIRLTGLGGTYTISCEGFTELEAEMQGMDIKLLVPMVIELPHKLGEPYFYLDILFYAAAARLGATTPIPEKMREAVKRYGNRAWSDLGWTDKIFKIYK